MTAKFVYMCTFSTMILSAVSGAGCATNAQTRLVEPGKSSLWLWKVRQCKVYLRFYSDGTVIGVCTSGEPAEIASWFNAPFDTSAKYTLAGSSVKFSLPACPALQKEDPPIPCPPREQRNGNSLDFSGAVRGSSLELAFVSQIDNQHGTSAFQLVPERSAPSGNTAESRSTQASTVGFKDNGNGTVTMSYKRTEVVWQQSDDGRQRNWDDAVGHCRSLSLGGRSDWRLPALDELVSLWSGAGSKEEMRKRYFPNIRSTDELYPGAVGAYWSSTSGGSTVLSDVGSDSAGFVNFNNGSVHVGTKRFFMLYCRCVRSGK